jgi:hypothetical protein
MHLFQCFFHCWKHLLYSLLGISKSCCITLSLVISLSSDHLPFKVFLTITLLTWRIWWAPNNASKLQMGFNWASKGLIWEEFWCHSRSFWYKIVKQLHVLILSLDHCKKCILCCALSHYSKFLDAKVFFKSTVTVHIVMHFILFFQLPNYNNFNSFLVVWPN